MTFLLLLLLSGCASSEWTRGDTYRQTAIIALQGIDWSQTRRIATEQDPQYVDLGGGASVSYAQPRYRHVETNPILGDHPTRGQVDAYFAASIAGNALVSFLLPPKYRAPWQYLSIGFQGAYVVVNFGQGIHP